MTRRGLPFSPLDPTGEQQDQARIDRLSKAQQERIQKADLSKSKNFRDHFRKR